MVVAHQALRLQRRDSSYVSTPLSGVDSTKEGGREDRENNQLFKEALTKRLMKMDDGRDSPMKRNSLIDRNYYIDKIQNFYDKHPQGPEALVDEMIEQFDSNCYAERSLKENYENLQILVKKK